MLRDVVKCLQASNKNSLYITGGPGVGKSTLFNSIVEVLRGRGCTVMGMIAPEVRSQGRRVGFKLVDLHTGEEAWLARAGLSGHPRVGRYVVLVEEAEPLGVKALERALKEADIIGVDEIGPMELLVPGIRSLIERIVASGKPKVGVIHRRLRVSEPRLYSVITASGCIIELTPSNRAYYFGISRLLAEAIAVEAGCDQGGSGGILHT